MGSECNGGKFRYDISMSRRTRKPLDREKEDNQCALRSSSCFSDRQIPREGVDDEKEDEHYFKVVDEGEESDHKSLKQLIEGRSTLGQHFTTEETKQPKLVHKQLQLVVRHHEEGLDGVRFKEMVSRCAKVLGRLIKNKRDPRIGSRRISTLR